jgi:hypothetical protein
MKKGDLRKITIRKLKNQCSVVLIVFCLRKININKKKLKKKILKKKILKKKILKKKATTEFIPFLTICHC